MVGKQYREKLVSLEEATKTSYRGSDLPPHITARKQLMEAIAEIYESWKMFTSGALCLYPRLH